MTNLKILNKFCLIYALFSSTLVAQEQPVPFKHLSINDGLSQAAVFAIIQDSKGFMWFGTQDGLNRYDGYNFKIYKHSREDSNTIIDNGIQSLFEDSDGMLWIGTRLGLSRLDPVTETFTSFTHAPDDSTSLSDNEVVSILEDRAGNLWFGTNRGGVNLYNCEKNQFQSFQHEPQNLNSLSHNRVRNILEDENGILWFATLGGGLNRFDTETGAFTRYQHKSGDNNFPNNFVMCVYRDPKRNNTLWVGTYGGGLIRFDSKNETFTQYTNVANDRSGLNDTRVFDIVRDARGRIWLGTFDGGLNVFNPEKETFQAFKHNPQKQASISTDFVRCLFIDAAQNLWAGTNLGGLNILDTKPQKFSLYSHEPDIPGSLQHNYVNAFQEGPDGSMWVATNEGLDRLGVNAGGFEHIQLNQSSKKPDDSFISGLAADRSNGIWIGTFGEGLCRYQTDTGVIQHFTESNAPFILQDRITALKFSSKNVLWIGTVSGLTAVHLSSKNHTTYQHRPDDPNSLASNRIACIIEDRLGQIWIGTTGGGLNKLNPATGDVSRFQNDLNLESSLSHDSVNAIYEDREGNIWVGTNNGLNRLSAGSSAQQFEYFTAVDGLITNYICSIVGDALGNLWIGTPKGISRLSPKLPKGRQFKNYDRTHGVAGHSFLESSAFVSSEGLIYFGGVKGFVKFDPLLVQDNPFSPKLALTSFKVFDRELVTDTTIVHRKEISLSYKQNFFSLEFAALDFTNPQTNRYAYKLEGIDEEWVDAGFRRYANYTNLDPGEYIFRLRGANNDGVWNEAGLTLAIKITPPFWQTWWFRLAIVLSGVGLLFLAYNYRVSRLLEVERTRNRIAQDLHDNVGATLSSISYFAQAIRVETDTDKKPVVQRFLSLITESSNEAQEAISDIIWSIDPANDRWERILAKFRRHASDLFESKAIEYEIDIPEKMPAKNLRMEARRNLWLIFKEMVANVAKHSNCRKASIQISNANGHIILQVTDDGTGFDENEFSDRSGLRNIRSRAQSLKGTVTLQTAPGKGTTWELRFSSS